MNKTDKLIEWKEDEKVDRNHDGIDDNIEPPIPDVSAGSRKLADRLKNDPMADPSITGGDVDSQWEGAQFSGDESAVSSMPTPEQNDVDNLGRAMGVTYQDNEELKAGEKERERDKNRWELDPASSDDYQERLKEEK